MAMLMPTPKGVGLGVAACCNGATDEREGRERGTGEFRLGQHGSPHPFKSGTAKAAAYPLVAQRRAAVQMVENEVKSPTCCDEAAGSETVEISLLPKNSPVMASTG
jgi:hypothetical protein